MRSLSRLLMPWRKEADPAPSRLKYRLERLWLTPTVRRVVRVGMPVGLGVFLAAMWITDEDRIQRILASVDEIRRAVEERPEFMVKLLEINGASSELNGAIRDVMPVSLPISSFDLDLEDMQEQVEILDAVKRVDIRVRAGGILDVSVEERIPALVWRGPDGLELIDGEGHRVQMIDSRHARPDLPLVAGIGADRAAAQALLLFHEADPIADRMIGLTRISELRWDVVLDRDQRILLPADQPVSALARVLAMHEAQDLLSRDVSRVDMRNGQRPTVRLTEAATLELRQMKRLVVREEN